MSRVRLKRSKTTDTRLLCWLSGANILPEGPFRRGAGGLAADRIDVIRGVDHIGETDAELVSDLDGFTVGNQS